MSKSQKEPTAEASADPKWPDASRAFFALCAGLENPPRNAKNPHFGNEYTSLDKLRDLIHEAALEEGLVVFQDVTTVEGDPAITTIFQHVSGDRITFGPLIMPASPDPQKVGGSITYGRRYALSACVGIAPEEDDDANRASRKNGPARQSNSRQSSGPPPASTHVPGDVMKKQHEIAMMLRDLVDHETPGLSEEGQIAAMAEKLQELTRSDTFDGWSSVKAIRNKKAANITHAQIRRAWDALPAKDDDGEGDPEPEREPGSDDDAPPPEINPEDDEIPF